jgi:hypothetical protein
MKDSFFQEVEQMVEAKIAAIVSIRASTSQLTDTENQVVKGIVDSVHKVITLPINDPLVLAQFDEQLKHSSVLRKQMVCKRDEKHSKNSQLFCFVFIHRKPTLACSTLSRTRKTRECLFARLESNYSHRDYASLSFGAK